MYTLTVKDTEYQLNFGMSFLRKLNKKCSVPVDGIPGAKKDIGMRYVMAEAIDGDLEALCQIIDTANEGCSPRISKKDLEAYIEDENTDIDEVFDTILGFLEKANVTKKEMKSIREGIKAEQEK